MYTSRAAIFTLLGWAVPNTSLVAYIYASLFKNIRERERTLFATQIRTRVTQYNNSLAWQVARKGITPIELATLKKIRKKEL